jgi:hypothetical protein
MSEWNMLVKRVFTEGRSKDETYKLKDAMKDAKKLYRKTTGKVGSMVSSVSRVVTGRRKNGKSKKTQRRRRSGRRR